MWPKSRLFINLSKLKTEKFSLQRTLRIFWGTRLGNPAKGGTEGVNFHCLRPLPPAAGAEGRVWKFERPSLERVKKSIREGEREFFSVNQL
jgi:hypothetical protein